MNSPSLFVSLARCFVVLAAIPAHVLALTPTVAPSAAPAPGASSTLDIRAFGADTGQPTHNDEAFRAAVSAARALGGGIVRIPVGQFTITRPIVLGPNLADVTLSGEGRASAIRATFAGPAILITGGAHLRIENLRITGRFSKGVYLTGRSRSIAIDGCWIDGATNDDDGRADAIGGVVLGDADDVSVTSSVFERNGSPSFDHGADVFALSNSNHAGLYIAGNQCSSTNVTFNIGLFNTSWSRVADNRVQGARVARSLENAGYGIMLYRTQLGAESGHNTISSNSVTDTQGSGIYLQNSPFSTVIGNMLARTASRQLDVKLQVAGVAVGRDGPVTIVGNSISASLKAGISIGGSGHSVVANLVNGANGPGIYLRDAQNATLSDNTILRASVGIRALPSPSPDGLTIRGNQIIDCSGSGMALQGLRHSILDSNHLSDNRGDAISLIDAENNRISGNFIQVGGSARSAFCAIRFAGCNRNKVRDNQLVDPSASRRLFCRDDSSSDNVLQNLTDTDTSAVGR